MSKPFVKKPKPGEKPAKGEKKTPMPKKKGC
jgi:hypothetical protein